MSMTDNNYCVILAGGVGRRLWPCSCKAMPKQFIDFFGVGRTLLQQTYDRMVKFLPKENIFVTTFVDYADIVKQQLPELDEDQILAEPVQLSTAPAVAWATYHIMARNPNANMLVTPSDQQIINEEAFAQDVTEGLEFVEKTPNFLALAVKPTHPDTSYGYIQAGDEEMPGGFTRVKTFTEKPDESFATVFVESGEFYWNTGLFMWNVKTMQDALVNFIPNIAPKLHSLKRKMTKELERYLVARYYPSNMYLAIDLVIFERCKNVFMKCCKFGWADVGSWVSLYDVLPKDENRNSVSNSAQALLYNSKDNLIKLPKGKVAVINGLDDFLVAENEKVLVICKKGDPASIRRMLNDAQMKLGEEYV